MSHFAFSALLALAAQQGGEQAAVHPRYALRADGLASLREHKVEEAIEAGLRWLRTHQDADGRWDSDGFMKHDIVGAKTDGPGNAVHDVGVTGLALLAFLAAGNTPRQGFYSESVRNGVGWLCRQQDRDSGLFGSDLTHESIYLHVIATLAVVEAYGLTGDDHLRAYAQKGIDYLEKHRNPHMVWRYRPRSGDNDTSVTGWATVAYRTAMDFGLDIESRALFLAEDWLDLMTDPRTGRTGYTERGGFSPRRAGDHATQFPREKGEAMTGVALFVRHFLGRSPAVHEGMKLQADLLAVKPPAWDVKGGAIDFYYWYYATHALAQAGGAPWRAWSRALNEALLPNQRTDDDFAGSWNPVGVWGNDGGRVFATALGVLSLEAPFRYARSEVLGILPSVSEFARANRYWREEQYGRFAADLDRAERRMELTAADEAAVARARTELKAEEAEAERTVERLAASTDYLAARKQLDAIEAAFGTLEAGRAAAAELERFRRDESIANELEAAERLEEILARYPDVASRQSRRFALEIRRLVALHEGTVAAQKARLLLGAR